MNFILELSELVQNPYFMLVHLVTSCLYTVLYLIILICSSVINSSRFCKRKLIELCFLLDNLLVEPLVRIQDIYVMPFEKLKLRGHPRFSNNNFRNLRSGLLSHLRWQQISPQAKHKLAVTKPQYGRFKSSSAQMNSSKSLKNIILFLEMRTISDFISHC